MNELISNNMKQIDQRCIKVSRLSSHIQEHKLDHQSAYYEELITEILNIPHAHRDTKSKEDLAHWMGYVDFFSHLRESHGEAYCRKFYANMTADSYKQGHLLIRSGDESDYFYIILKGAAMVLYPRRKVDIEQDCKAIDPSELSRMTHRDKIWRRLENHTHFKGVPLNSIDDYERYFNDFGVSMVSVENVLEKGRAFGELGILYKTQRMADIICKYDCLIAKVSKERYTKIIGDEGERKIARTLQFLNEHFYSKLSRMMRVEAHRYLYLFDELEWKVNTTIFEFNSPLQGLYIIREGSVVIKAIELSDNNCDPRSIKRYGIFKSHKKNKLVAFKQLGPGESFGIESYMKAINSPGLKCNYEVSTSSKVKVLYCSINKLAEIIRVDKELERQLKRKFAIKQELNPIHQMASPESKLKKYWSMTRDNEPPEYRISPKLLLKPNTIRSSRVHSLHDQAQDKQNSKMLLIYNHSVMPLYSWAKTKSKLEPKKCMSRALQVCVTDNIAVSLQKKLSQWKKHKGQSAESNRIIQRQIDRKNIQMRVKHIRLA